MVIAYQILLILISVFTLIGLMGDDRPNSRLSYTGVLIASIISLLVTFIVL